MENRPYVLWYRCGGDEEHDPHTKAITFLHGQSPTGNETCRGIPLIFYTIATGEPPVEVLEFLKTRPQA